MTRRVTGLLLVLFLIGLAGCSGAVPVSGPDDGAPGGVAPAAALDQTPQSEPTPAATLASPTQLPTAVATPTGTADPTATPLATATREPPTPTIASASPVPEPTDAPVRAATAVTATATVASLEAAGTPSPQAQECPYVGNQNTGKFHRADCRSVGQMAEHNKVCLPSREDAVLSGYVPCKICSP